ncbi:MAG: TIGR01777 family oxidoreductase [Verrucomicrobiota bacterium]
MKEVDQKPWRIAITGGTGLIGRELRKEWEEAGHEVLTVSRKDDGNGIFWDPENEKIDIATLEGLDAVVHLAGEPIAQRWTGEVRERIYSSRVKSTRLLVRSFAKLKTPPRVFLSASGINYYPSTEMGARLDEQADVGDDFLSRVCLHWEAEASKANPLVSRVCLLRTAVVLSPLGGALAKLLPVFSKGLGGRIGTGKQPFPWISIGDYKRVCSYLLFDSELTGPINVVAPKAATNESFTKALAKVLGKPASLAVPKMAIRLAFGEMGRLTVIEGVDAAPAALLSDGFEFQDSDLEEALEDLLA